jgi:hypothetical protein
MYSALDDTSRLAIGRLAGVGVYTEGVLGGRCRLDIMLVVIGRHSATDDVREDIKKDGMRAMP